ncbi:adenylosuccinate lyase [candidate division FCPU426 bacterium]|nr:adenylosuccinate lyase [candidate division FCPU426 bacterium]
MIERYTSQEMLAIWSETRKLETWLTVELAVAEAQANLGIIPKKIYRQMKNKARINPRRAAEIEKTTNHDMIAFVSSTAESMGAAGRYLHFGLTSSDVVDTAQSLRLREASDLIDKQLQRLETVLTRQAKKYQQLVMIGRSHGVHAEPITLGLKLAVFLAQVRRQRIRFSRARRAVEVCKLSGAVGTYANQDPRVETRVSQRLELEPEVPATQVVSRDRHADYLCVLAQISGTLENIAVEIRHLHRSEVREVEEFFARGQKGSSAMPHKRNPILCERISGLARLQRGYALTALQNMSLWHERDISHSSVERIILPDATATLEYQCKLMTQVLEHMVVYPRNIQQNLHLTFGLIHSQQVLLALVNKGMSRDDAYRKVQTLAMKAWEKRIHFRELLRKDQEISKFLKSGDIQKCFDIQYHTKHIEKIFKRMGIGRVKARG